MTIPRANPQVTDPQTTCSPSSPGQPNKDSFGTEIPDPRPQANRAPPQKLHAQPAPNPVPLGLALSPPGPSLSSGEPKPAPFGFSLTDIESLKALGIEVCIKPTGSSYVRLVPSYTGQTRREITPEHLAALVRAIDASPESLGIGLRRRAVGRAGERSEVERSEVEDMNFRFWSRVAIGNDDECWPWRSYRGKDGFGRTSRNGKGCFLVHRLAYELAFGEIPDGLCVMHVCDTPACVNPAHLRLATHRDTVAKWVAKGRHARGEKAGAAKLTSTDVRAIRIAVREGESQGAVARRFGVCPRTVWMIINGRTWRHVPME